MYIHKYIFCRHKFSCRRKFRSRPNFRGSRKYTCRRKFSGMQKFWKNSRRKFGSSPFFRCRLIYMKPLKCYIENDNNFERAQLASQNERTLGGIIRNIFITVALNVEATIWIWNCIHGSIIVQLRFNDHLLGGQKKCNLIWIDVLNPNKSRTWMAKLICNSLISTRKKSSRKCYLVVFCLFLSLIIV